jgi:hypothetical protein
MASVVGAVLFGGCIVVSSSDTKMSICIMSHRIINLTDLSSDFALASDNDH